MSRKVFISYRRDSAKYQARQIYGALCRVLPQEQVFMDTDSIPPGADFRAILKGWVDQCDVMLALISPGWAEAIEPKTGKRRLDNASDFVRIEVAAGLARDIPVVPILLDQAELPERDSLPGDLQNLVDRQAQFIEFRTFDHDVERLIARLGLAADGSVVVQPSAGEQPGRSGDSIGMPAHRAPESGLVGQQERLKPPPVERSLGAEQVGPPGGETGEPPARDLEPSEPDTWTAPKRSELDTWSAQTGYSADRPIPLPLKIAILVGLAFVGSYLLSLVAAMLFWPTFLFLGLPAALGGYAIYAQARKHSPS